MFFDLEIDPLEQNNLSEVSEYAEVMDKMRCLLKNWMQKTNDPLLKGRVKLPSGARVTPSSSYHPGQEDMYKGRILYK